MAIFSTRIEDYVGSFADTQALSDWLTAGARLHLRLMPPSELEKYASTITDAGAGISVKDKVLLSVDKNGYESRAFPASMRARLSDSDSIFYATTKSPAHYIRTGNLFVVPGGGTAEAIDMPTVSHDDDEIDELPPDLEDATVIYAALQAIQKNINDAIGNITVDPTYPSPPSLTAYPSAPSLSVTASSVTSTTIGALPSQPTYSQQIPPSSPTYSSPSKPSLSGNYTGLDTAISDDDFEKAASIINEINTQLQEYQSDIEEAIGEYANDIREYSEVYNGQIKNAVAEFNSNNADYQREVDRLIEQARIQLQEEAKNADLSQQADIEQERLDLQLFSQQVQQVAEENRGIINKYAQEVQAIASEVDVDLRASSGKAQMLIEQSNSLRMEYKTLLSPYMQQQQQ